jgi:hypothetical protein
MLRTEFACRTALALAVLLAGAGTLVPGDWGAQAQTADWWKLSPAEREALLRPPRIVIGYDEGGDLQKYEVRWKGIAASGREVAITHSCQSACTMVVAFVPRERLCFAKAASLDFHQAVWTGTRKVSPAGTRWMYDHYPPAIQSWLDNQGGIKEMPNSNTMYWTLSAETLWQMGYRRCE